MVAAGWLSLHVRQVRREAVGVSSEHLSSGERAEQRCFGRRVLGMVDDEHNCIPISYWFRRRWVCVKCQRIFKADVR